LEIRQRKRLGVEGEDVDEGELTDLVEILGIVHIAEVTE